MSCLKDMVFLYSRDGLLDGILSKLTDNPYQITNSVFHSPFGTYFLVVIMKLYEDVRCILSIISA